MATKGDIAFMYSLLKNKVNAWNGIVLYSRNNCTYTWQLTFEHVGFTRPTSRSRNTGSHFNIKRQNAAMYNRTQDDLHTWEPVTGGADRLYGSANTCKIGELNAVPIGPFLNCKASFPARQFAQYVLAQSFQQTARKSTVSLYWHGKCRRSFVRKPYTRNKL